VRFGKVCVARICAVVLLWIVSWVAHAPADDLRVMMGDGQVRNYSGAEVKSAVAGPDGVRLMVALEAGGEAYPLELARVQTIQFTEDNRRFRMTLRSQNNGAPNEVYNDVRLVAYQGGYLLAVPPGAGGSYPIDVTRLIGLDPGTPASGNARPPQSGPPTGPPTGSQQYATTQPGERDSWDDSWGEDDDWDDIDFSSGSFYDLLRTIHEQSQAEMNALQKFVDFFSCWLTLFFIAATIWTFIAAIQQKDVIFAILIPVTCCIPIARWYFSLARYEGGSKGFLQGGTVLEMILWALGLIGALI